MCICVCPKGLRHVAYIVSCCCCYCLSFTACGHLCIYVQADLRARLLGRPKSSTHHINRPALPQQHVNQPPGGQAGVPGAGAGLGEGAALHGGATVAQADDDYDECVPTDVEVALISLRHDFYKSPACMGLPPVALRSHLYSVLKDHTAVDREVDELRLQNKVRLFKLVTGRCDSDPKHLTPLLQYRCNDRGGWRLPCH